ncbi:MAG: mechanosensitive ion channel family protein [Sphaerobacter sp.]|nr:mechanosensitive ion channel family protein [Sphaerobacter sp.]
MRFRPPVASAIDQSVTTVTSRTDRLLDEALVLGQQAVGPALQILLIIGVSLLLLRLLRSAVRTTASRVLERADTPPRELATKANTLAHVIESGGRLVIMTVAGMMVLSKLGVNIAPLLASAGIAGIAIGLGAQSLIKDVIGGFFILLENQYGVGDVIQVGAVSGVVEQLSLRRTGLRALDGSFIVVPNGDIRTVTNMTKDWSRAVIDVAVPYDADLDRVLALLHEMVDGLGQDPVIGDAVIGPGEITGVEALESSHISVRVLVKTRPMEQWRVQRELRRRIRAAFHEAGIGAPYPRSVTLIRSADGEGLDRVSSR